MPCVPTTVVDAQPPARIVCERLLAGLWDVERGIQLREFVGGHEHGWPQQNQTRTRLLYDL